MLRMGHKGAGGDIVRLPRGDRGSLVSLHGPARSVAPRKARGPLDAESSALAIPKGGGDRSGGRGGIMGLEVAGYIAPYFPQDGDIGAGDRDTTSHALENRESKPLRQRGEHPAIGH